MDAAIVCSFCVRERVMPQHNRKTSTSESPAVHGNVGSNGLDDRVYDGKTMHERVVDYEGLGQPDASTSARAVGR
eukprot:3003549-Rhodomonas_salina.1